MTERTGRRGVQKKINGNKKHVKGSKKSPTGNRSTPGSKRLKKSKYVFKNVTLTEFFPYFFFVSTREKSERTFSALAITYRGESFLVKKDILTVHVGQADAYGADLKGRTVTQIGKVVSLYSLKARKIKGLKSELVLTTGETCEIYQLVEEEREKPDQR